jgi:oxygen-independent coproporphyrinogen-3 oxidase
MHSGNIIFDRDLIEKCQINAPRYTSYPTADRFSFAFTRQSQLTQLHQIFTATKPEAISLYIHIPFCNTLCLYCGCNKVITNDRTNITKYLTYLQREMQLYYSIIGQKLDVIQLHFGGGSPSWLSIAELNQVMEIVRDYFNLATCHEVAMEIDPRHTNYDFILALKNNGFNRISIGVQDFDSKVQKAVNRVQSYAESKLILDSADRLGFKSTNVDLIYGLPFQTVTSFSRTIDTIIDLRPARIALFNYAHLPHIFMPQSRIRDEDLPTAAEKLDILHMSIDKLSAAGYVFIGMDHFALPNDELALALKQGTLQRNFQGYSTFANSDMLAFGVSSIGFVGNSYYQNVKDLTSYYQQLDNDELPILRGVVLTEDDLIRRSIIQEIMCQFALDFSQLEQKFDLVFSQYFAHELIQLQDLVKLELIEFSPTGFKVTAKGRFLIRNVAVVFDKYLQQVKDNKRYSKVI